MTRRRKIFVFLPALVLLLAAGGMAWLMRTEAGARWLWSQAQSATPGLRADSLSGSLRSGLSFRNLAWTDDDLRIGADRADVEIALDLLPPAVSIRSLRIATLTLAVGGAPQDSGGGDSALMLESLAMHPPVRIADARIERLIWDQPGDRPDETFERLSFNGRWGDSLALERLHLERADGARLQGAASLSLDAPFPARADLQLTLGGDGPFLVGQAFSTRLHGDLESMQVDVRAEQTGARLSGTLDRLLADPAWNLEFLADRLSVATDDGEAIIRDIAVSTDGSPDSYRVQAASHVEWPGQEPVAVTVEGQGTLDYLDIESARLVHPAGQVGATGHVAITSEFGAVLDITIDAFDPGPWLEAWPQGFPVMGSGKVEWAEQRVSVSDARLAVDGTAGVLTGNANWDPQGGRVEGDIAWRDLQWPLSGDSTSLNSARGSLRLSGSPEDWSASGQVALSAPDLPESELRLTAAGSHEAVAVDVERGELLGGAFAGQLRYRWSGTPEWSADVVAENLHTGPLLPRYPGSVSGKVALRGWPESSRIELAIEALEGEVRGRRVRADGRLSISGGLPTADKLQLRSGDSIFTLDGHPSQPGGLAFRADIASLGDVLDEAAGALEGEGVVEWNGGPPRAVLNLEGRDLAWADWRVGSLSVRPLGSGGGPGAHAVELVQADLSGYAVDRMTLRSDGAQPLQQIEAAGEIDGTRLTLSMTGAVADWNDPLASGWRGRVETWQAQHETLGFLELDTPANVAASSRAVTLESACFRGTRDGRICTALDWQAGDELAINARLDSISLDILRLFATTDIALTQRLTGTVDWRRPANGPATGEVRIQVSPGQIAFPNDEDAVIDTGAGAFGFTLLEGRVQSGHFDLPLVDAGQMDSDFEASDLSRGADTPVDGRIRIELQNLSPIARLLPSLDRLEGRLSADLRVTGTVSDPVLTGHASLVRGRIEHFASGLVLSDVQLAGAVYEFDYTELNGTFRAGEGQGRIKATLGFGDWLRPEVTLELSGQNLTLVDVPDLGLAANPDLRLHWSRGVLELGGRLEVPYAKISPRLLPTAVVAESPDLVIVAGTPPETEEPLIDESRLKIRGQVDVVLGEDVTVTLERAKAEFGGTVTFLWDDQLMPVGDGTILMTGEINAYGQLLRISEGRIRFGNKPADNPQLSIRAEREIYGNRQVNRAGVLITGTLKQPVLETYTDPMTTQERALTLLVTGNDFDYEQGAGAVEVGMYVAPRLYVSYGIGLFDEGNVISARYDLKRGFGVKATSGERETGVDISYTIER